MRLGRRRTLSLSIALGVVLSLVGVAGPTPARATDGATLRQITAATPGCSVGTGIAFDGQRLLTSCWYTSELYAVDPADGSLLATIPVDGMNGIGALAYDRSRNAV